MRELTRRQADVVLLRAVGIQAKEGAQRLNISIHTYRAHLRHGLELIRFRDPRSIEDFEELLKNRNGVICALVLNVDPPLAKPRGKSQSKSR